MSPASGNADFKIGKTMSLLRISGLICSLIPLTIVFYRLRTQSENRTDVWLLTLFGLALFLVSLFPAIVNLPAEILFHFQGQGQGGRIITLLLLSSGLLWFLVLLEKSKSDDLKWQFDDYQRKAAVLKTLNSPDLPGSVQGIVVIIPALNEAENLGRFLPAIPKQIRDLPVVPMVVDDGSTDQTARVARANQALVVEHPVTRGGGSALKTGYALAQALGSDYIVTMDGDGQHDPTEIPLLLQPILGNASDLVVGSRMLGAHPGSSRIRLLGVLVFGKIISLLLGRQVTDCASGFRAFTGKVLSECVFMQEQYHTAELLIEAVKRGFRVQEVPVTIHRRASGTSKKGVNWKYGLMFFRTVIRTWLR